MAKTEPSTNRLEWNAFDKKGADPHTAVMELVWIFLALSAARIWWVAIH